jgi:phage portal protein BeeE
MGKTAVSVLEFQAHKVPEFKEQASKDWILYGTEAPWINRYPDYLLHIYDRSAKHYAIVNGKVDYVIGQGVSVNDRGLNTEQVAKLSKFINEPNPMQNLNDLIAMCSLDLEIFGGFALEILYDKKGKMAEIYHAEFAKYRVNKDGKTFYHCDDWKKAKADTITTIPAFDWNKPSGKQLLYIKAYHPKADHYPLPPYLGAIPYIELDSEIANFHLNSVKNGFMAGTVFSFNNGQPTEEEQEKIEEKIEEKFSGTDNANKILLLFNDSKEQGVQIDPMSSNGFEDRFDILNKTVQQEIFSGHRVVDPALFGIKEEGVFSGRTQIRDSYELFKNTYVRARQAFIIDIFNELAALNGFEKRLSIIDSEPISEGYSEMTKVSVMTRDEIREAVGLPPMQPAQIATELKLASEDFESENRIADAFATVGLSLSEWEVVKPLRHCHFNSEKEWMAFEDGVKRYGFESDPFLMGVLNAIKENPVVTYSAIAELLGTSVDVVAQGVIELARQGLLSVGSQTVAGSSQIAYEVSKNGLSELAKAKPMGVSFKIAYRYVKSQEATGADVLPTTRQFCRKMIASSETKLWTSEDIQAISMREDRNVWMRRGGFWTRKGTDVTTSYCRHSWESVIVKSKV